MGVFWLLDAGRGPTLAVEQAVISRDGMICRYCGVGVVRSPAHRPDRLHFDHVIPWAEGGPTTADNLVVSCAACNLSRVRPRQSVRLKPGPGLMEIMHYRYGAWRWSSSDVLIPTVLEDNAVHYDTIDGLADADPRGRQTVWTVLWDVLRGRTAANAPSAGEQIWVARRPGLIRGRHAPRRRRLGAA